MNFYMYSQDDENADCKNQLLKEAFCLQTIFFLMLLILRLTFLHLI